MKHRRIISLITATALIVSMFASMSIMASATETVFDENNVVLRFPALSDIHMQSSSTDKAAQNFKRALTYSKTFGNLDAAMFVGDFTDYGTPEQVDAFATVLDGNVDLTKTRAVIAPGNHELYNYDLQGKPFDVIPNLIKKLGKDKIYQGVTENEIAAGNYKTEVKGYTMIGLNCWTYLGGVKFRPEDLTWLDNTLKTVPKDKPVFIAFHPAARETHYGSNFNAYFSTIDDDLKNILSKYPQAITFSGHLHFPVNNDQIIWQGGYTAIGTGSVRYASFEEVDPDQNKYITTSSTDLADADKISNGLIVEVDKNNNTRITRLDFAKNQVIKKPFVVDAPKADKSHLTKYTIEGMKAKNTAPSFASDLKVTAKPADAPLDKNLIVEFDAASDDDMVFGYQIKFVSNLYNKVIKTIAISTDFYKNPDPSTMIKKISVNIPEKALKPFYNGYFEDYRIEVTALDSLAAKSSPIKSDVFAGTGEKPIEVVIDETAEPDWQYKQFTSFNTFENGYTLNKDSDYGSWPTSDMEGAAQHQPMKANGYGDTMALTTKVMSTNSYYDALFTTGGTGYKEEILGAKEFWIWIDASNIELKDIYFGFRTGGIYETGYLTKNTSEENMNAYIQKGDKWIAVPFTNGSMSLSNYKGFVRFDASYFTLNGNSLYPADIKAFEIGYSAKDNNSVGKMFTIDQIGFAGPTIQKNDGIVKELLESKKFSDYVLTDQADMKDTIQKNMIDFEDDIFILGDKMSNLTNAAGKNVTSPEKSMGKYLDLEVVSYPTDDNKNNKAIALENLDGEYNGVKNGSDGLFAEVLFRPRKSINSSQQYLAPGKGIANTSKENGLMFYVDTTKYLAGGLTFQPLFHEYDYNDDGTPNKYYDAETDKTIDLKTIRGVASGAEYYIEVEDGKFALGGVCINNYISVPSNYKGNIKIPFDSFELRWSDNYDANNKVDLMKFDKLSFYYGCYKERKGPVVFDNFGFYGPAFEQSSTIEGDVDGNGKLSTLDALIILKHIAKIEILTSDKISIADCDKDTKVTTLDVLFILKKLAKLE